jgi:ArsR family transcriptional regulator
MFDTLSIDDTSKPVNGSLTMAAVTSSPTTTIESGACCGSILAAPLDVADATELAQGFSALADPVRLRVLSILAAAPEGEVCVCDFVGPLEKSQPTVSHHLKILSESGLVKGERRGKWVWYSLNRARLAELQATITA